MTEVGREARRAEGEMAAAVEVVGCLVDVAMAAATVEVHRVVEVATEVLMEVAVLEVVVRAAGAMEVADVVEEVEAATVETAQKVGAINEVTWRAARSRQTGRWYPAVT